MRMSRTVQLLALATCLSVPTVGVVAGQTAGTFSAADSRALSGIVDEYWAAWEPQRISEKGLVEISDRIFEHGPTFSMVVDAVFYPSWAVRAPKIPTFVAQTKAEDKEGAHKTLDERVLPLGRDAASLTRVYRYTFTEVTGKRGHHDSAATFVFVRSNGNWKIVQYHGSHGQRVYDK